MRRWRGLGPCALVVGAIVIVYGQVVSFDFAPIDDSHLVTSNPLYQPVSLEHLWQPWAEPVLHLYMPVTYTFYALEAAISQQQSRDGQYTFHPAVFHAGNLLLHCLNACLVLLIARWLTEHGVAALLAALFFALHPLQAEAVAWISETKGILCNFFCLTGLAILIYRQRFLQARPPAAWVAYAAMNVAFLFGLLAKPAAIAVIPIAWLIAVGFLQRSAVRSALELAPSATVAVLISVVAKRAQGDELLWFIPPANMRPLIAGDTIAFYLVKLVCPLGLTVDYARTPEAVLQTRWIWLAWIVPVFLAGALALLPHRRLWLTALAIFIVGVAPVSGLVSFVFQAFSTVSDRYVYLSMLGPSLAIAWFFTLYAQPRWIAACGVLLAGLALLSAQQTSTWKSATSLFAQAAATQHAGYLTESSQGNWFADAGNTEEAVEHLSRAAEIQPKSFSVRHKLGAVFLNAGHPSEAIPYFQEVVRLKPDYAEGHNDLGVALGKANRPQEATAAFQEAIRLKPNDIDFHTHLMIACAQAKRREEAIRAAEGAIELARAQKQPQMAAKVEAWLRNYRASPP
ncbi:MAG TPA: tetratricopeptide repeat protein [Pirellulales bacterium]|nr:tetratricopeptide repeat protein [Pirellulales bacterium]